MGRQNKQFLSLIAVETKASILASIADHYGITVAEALDEVSDEEAEHLLDYLVEPVRSAASVLMQRHGFIRGI